MLRKADFPVEDMHIVKLMEPCLVLLAIVISQLIIIIKLIIIHNNIRNIKSDINTKLYNMYEDMEMINDKNRHINTNTEITLNNIERLIKYQKQNEAKLASVFKLIRNLYTKKNKANEKLKTAEKSKITTQPKKINFEK